MPVQNYIRLEVSDILAMACMKADDLTMRAAGGEKAVCEATEYESRSCSRPAMLFPNLDSCRMEDGLL